MKAVGSISTFSNAIRCHGHGSLVGNSPRHRYPRASLLWFRIFPGSDRYRNILGHTYRPVAVYPDLGKLHIRGIVVRAGLIVPQQTLQLLHHLPLVLQVAELLQDLIEQRIRRLRRRRLERSGSSRTGQSNPPAVPVVLNPVRAWSGLQTLPGRALSAEARRGGARGRHRVGIQEGVWLDAGASSGLTAVPRSATTRWCFRGSGYRRGRLAEALGGRHLP